jgi:hypothetical protein
MAAGVFSNAHVSGVRSMTPDQLADCACRLVDLGQERGVTLRLLGSLGARMQSTRTAALLDRLGREPTHDIDFMGYSRDQARAHALFLELGYQADTGIALSLEYGVRRLIFYKQPEGIMVEIFLDQLCMAHTVDFRGRLDFQDYSVAPTDLILSKLQIQEIAKKDIKDIIALLATVDLSRGGGNASIDVGHITDILGRYWGFYHTARGNLERVREWSERLREELTEEERVTAEARACDLIEAMDAAPKTLRWRVRSMIGPRVKWYADVGDVHR